MDSATAVTGPYPALIAWLGAHGVPYTVQEHPLTFTAVGTARVEGIDTTTFAKVVGVRTSEGWNALAVVDASDQVDLKRLSAAMGVPWVALLGEDDLAAMLPDCEVGTAPPIPELVGVPVYVDEAVLADARITFHAGSHRYTVRLDREAWEREARIRRGRFGVRRQTVRYYVEHGWT